ncbi:hypothetical protein Poli38472_001284 [Pythium oligandrum]|uniref:Uncharacterized protein n=1 Tax=Pythium oligandrum TaxID=41045 RepID=A0A8K1CVQ6_PYTOL|nr:hypothetical protein Poli38472_001284 [Pythium oligandrum]|eukprot:TMW69128.1 hypothetical protein Poli38472_001284 [Pythium oligandrum]
MILLGSASAKKQGYSTFEASLQDQAPPTPPRQTYATSSWLSRLVFGYARPVLDVGKTRQLEMEDLWRLDGENRTSVAYAAYRRSYLQHNKSVTRALFATYGLRFFVCGLGSMVMAACAVFAPMVLQHVIDAFSAPVIDVEDLTLWVGAFFLSRLINAFCEAHINYNIEITILRLTVSLKSLIFEKAMRRSIQSKNDNTLVDISNLFTADIDSVLWAGYDVNSVWILPIQISVVVYMLYDILNVAAFAGLGVIFISMIFNYFVAKAYMNAYNSIMEFKDQRMKAIKEAFGAIQIVKLNAWESKFFDRIQAWRLKETQAIAKYLYMVAVSIFLFWTSPLAVSATSFATYALVLGETLTASKVFTAMVLFNAVRDPLANFPEALQSVLQGRISLMRMAKYLDADEVHPERIARDVQNYENDVAISIENARFKWDSNNVEINGTEAEADTKKTVLHDVNLQVRDSDFVVIHGPVGAGKSSLVAAMLGELPRSSGKVFVRTDKVAYYSQQPWIQNMTIRDNILFGLPFDTKKYERVLDACGLVKDVAQFPAGDKTEIGQKGVNLSGGQRARVSLARACYADADIYILDSPLAAVDAVVQSEIFNKCFCRLLEKKTVVLVTHLHDVIESDAANVKISISSDGVVSVDRRERVQARRLYATLHVEDEEDQEDAKNEEAPVIDEKLDAPSGTLVEDEEREAGRVSANVFKTYYEALGGHKVAVLYIATLAVWQSLQVNSDIWLSHWTGSKPGTESLSSVEYNLGVYALFGVAIGFVVLFRALILPYTAVRASRKLFDDMTQSLLHAPLRFFDANPIGRIINRYSEDISNIDFKLPFNFFGIFISTSLNVAQILAAIYVIKYAGILILPLAFVYIKLSDFYLATSREISRHLKVATSPILSHISQSEEGVAVLRAFGPSYIDRAILENFERIDVNNRVWYAQTLVNQWFALRIQLIGFVIVVIVVSSLLVLREYLTPGLVGLAFMYAVNIDGEIKYMVKHWSALEITMVSPERVGEYIGIPSEGRASDRQIVLSQDAKEWPQGGSLTFDNVVFAYKTGGEPVLKGLSFSVQQSEKIGIVGRTGAGKSSLTMALFRTNELESGRIVIDGQDISTINLQTLRSSMSIIPQVPVLFKGSMRAYMDPFGEYDDADIWQAFDKIGLKDMISALDGKLDHELSENGENFSVGERQMLCLARALLRRSRVVVMDEATASIDLATEQKLQAMIQREFVDATVLTIAHRLATVLDSDRILVLSDGRMVEFDTPKRLARLEGGVFRELAQESGYLVAGVVPLVTGAEPHRKLVEMSRGRGRGRVRFGGSRDPALADVLDETREDLGLSHTQMEMLHAESGAALYPPLQLPQPEALTDRDAYLIQRQRVVAHKLENLYHPWGQNSTMTDATDPAAFVHVTMPETQKAGEIFVPEELRSNTLSGMRVANLAGSRNVMKPRAFENVFKSLEAQEQQSQKANAPDQDDAGDMDEQDEDLGDDMNDYTFDYYDSDAGSDDGDEEVFF